MAVPVALLAAAVTIALSPVLRDLAVHWVEEPSAQYSLLFVPLAALAAVSDPVRRPIRRDGYLWLAIAAALVVFAVGAGLERVGRLAIPLAALGLARLAGRPSLARAALAAWIVPVPTALVRAAPDLERLVAAGLAAVGLGALEPHGDALAFVAAGGSLPLGPADGGLPLAVLLAGLGWLRGSLRGARTSRLVAGSLCWALCAIPIQVVALAVAVAALHLGAPALGRAWLDHALWVCVAVAALIRVWPSSPPA